MDEQCGDCHLLTLFTLYLCVKRGCVGPSIAPGSWDGAGGNFVFLNTFVFFSLARFGFSKKSDEKQRSNKVHPNYISKANLKNPEHRFLVHIFYFLVKQKECLWQGRFST